MYKLTYFYIHFPTYLWSCFEFQKEAKNNWFEMGMTAGKCLTWHPCLSSKGGRITSPVFHLKIRNCNVSKQTRMDELGSIGQDHKKSKHLLKLEHGVVILSVPLVSSMYNFRSLSSIFSDAWPSLSQTIYYQLRIHRLGRKCQASLMNAS